MNNNNNNRAFVCRNVDLLVPYVYISRTFGLSLNTVIWSPYTWSRTLKLLKETVQRHFTKRLPGFCSLSYAERLKRLNLPSLELRRLHADLIYCYKVVFGLTDLRLPVIFSRCSLHHPGAHLQAVPEALLYYCSIKLFQ